MQAFRLSAKALADLKSIGRFTLKSWGREQRNIYLKCENLVLWARSELIGCAFDRLCFLVSGFRFQFHNQNPAILIKCKAEIWKCDRHFGFVSCA